jgi:hypothetical protein
VLNAILRKAAIYQQTKQANFVVDLTGMHEKMVCHEIIKTIRCYSVKFINDCTTEEKLGRYKDQRN